jgi:hypothetical protein
MEYDIGSAFLIIGLFFPRFVLFFWWLTGNLPFNTTPLWGDLLLSIFFPRALFCIWIYDIQGASGWFITHLVAAIIAFVYHAVNFKTNYKKAQEIADKANIFNP